jgi:hypothetical protein
MNTRIRGLVQPYPDQLDALQVATLAWSRSAGNIPIRAVQLLKPVLVALKMTPIVEAVNIPFVGQHIKDGRFEGTESMLHAAQTLLSELQRSEELLSPLRTSARER